MIAAWMLAATVFAVLLGLAAHACERALAALGRSTRGVWAAALAAAAVWPVLAPVTARLITHYRSSPLPELVLPSYMTTVVVQRLPAAAVASGSLIERGLLVAWMLASTILLVRLVLAARAIARVERQARAAMLDGEPVIVTDALGPAVVGVRAPRVAVPAWFLDLDAGLRALVLRHEREHCRARDPQLVWLAAIAVALMPFNVGIWFIARRLRLALEIDCDARTLRATDDVDRYGKLLLLIAQRQARHPLVTMLTDSSSHLGRRITAMQSKPVRRPVVHVAVAGLVAAGAIAAACSPFVATDLAAQQPVTRAPQPKPLDIKGAYFEFQVEKPVTMAAGSPHIEYPATLKSAGIEGQVLAQFVVNEEGLAEMETFKVLKSDNDGFTDAIMAGLPAMRFTPAEVKGVKVRQLVQQPFVFAISGKADVSAKPATVSAKPAQPAPGSGNVVKPDLPSEANGTPYFEFQVTAPVKSAPGSVGPVYPEALKAAKVEGKVLAQFVVDTDGIPDVRTLKILKSDDPEFTAAVQNALGDMRFVPAEVEGRKVKQLVQQIFQFAVPK